MTKREHNLWKIMDLIYGVYLAGKIHDSEYERILYANTFNIAINHSLHH